MIAGLPSEWKKVDKVQASRLGSGFRFMAAQPDSMHGVGFGSNDLC